MALLEADVALPVVKTFIEAVRAKVVGQELDKSLTPGQTLVRIINDELVALMGEGVRPLNLRAQPPVVILLAGLQGAGKTTSAAKLAKWLKENERKKVLLASTDVYRPAAILQLERLATQLDIGFFPSDPKKSAVVLAQEALTEARRSLFDVLIVDTAGRLHVDEDMMREARRVKDAIDPHHVVMACDAMTGQDAVIQARAFMKEVDTTGFVLTKIDGDARGGAALSITAVTGRPVFFAGTGERPEDLEPFFPDRMASRIMGMGDVLSLIDKAQENLDQEKAAETAEKMLSARFTLEDFLVQMQELRKLGPLQDLLAMLPSVPGGKNALKDLEVDEGQLGRAQAIIQSMTREERQNPAIIGGSRRSRIARGSGVTTADVNALLKEFEQAKKMMKSMLGGKRMPRVPGMPNLPGIG
jgi:signal recognition particle subunit SRP54